MKAKRLIISAVILGLLIPFAASAASDAIILALNKGPGKAPRGWQLLCSNRSATCYFTEEGSVEGFCIRTDDSKNFVQKKVHVDVKEYPYVTWRWMVKELPADGDCRNSNTDDQAAQLYIAFDDKHVIGYIWDTNAPVGKGAEYDAPLLSGVKTIVVQSGEKDKGRWVSMTRNVRKDYRRLFGGEPPEAMGIRFQANSQHTNTIAEACLERVEFTRTGKQ
jgi:Protein of unknown function (DUF3047)